MIRNTTLLFALLLSGTAIAQIPNASFESWTAHTGYDTPDSWGNTNSITTLAGVYTCTKGTSGAPDGADFLQLTAQTVPVLGVIPGVAVTGNINVSGTTYSVTGGFAFNTRPANITGKWQYSASGADQGYVGVFLSKWNMALGRRDTVSFTKYALPSPAVTSWTSFSIPLTYQKGSLPDTAMVLLSSSGTTPVANSYLYADALAFSGNVPSGVVTVVNNEAATSIYPNPAKGSATIYYYSLFSGDMKINITDMSGRIVKKITAQLVNGSNNIPLDLSGLVKGDYVVDLLNGMGTESTKFVIE